MESHMTRVRHWTVVIFTPCRHAGAGQHDRGAQDDPEL